MKRNVADFGGNRRGCWRKASYSHKCRDCGAMRFTSKSEWGRAAKPRCHQCGGPLIETDASEKRHYGGTKNQRQKRVEKFQQAKHESRINDALNKADAII